MDGPINDSKYLADYKELYRCKQVLLASNLRAIFIRLYVDKSPEQDAEGRVELGFNTNSGWCPCTHHWKHWYSFLGQAFLHRPASLLQTLSNFGGIQEHESDTRWEGFLWWPKDCISESGTEVQGYLFLWIRIWAWKTHCCRYLESAFASGRSSGII